MPKEYLETKVRKAIYNIDKNVSDIKSVIGDLSMKLCYIIKNNRKYYYTSNGNDYSKYK